LAKLDAEEVHDFAPDAKADESELSPWCGFELSDTTSAMNARLLPSIKSFEKAVGLRAKHWVCGKTAFTREEMTWMYLDKQKRIF
jgi:hypothetical protein